MLVDLTAVDYDSHAKKAEVVKQSYQRFKLVYRLMSLNPEQGLVNGRLAVACWLDGTKGPQSIRDLWANADWLEREVWDMFGIQFEDRPDIKRLLLYEEFVGHALRKDYPINKRQPLIGPDDSVPRDRMLSGDLRPKVT
jgi:NADH-quinone oxidoreductase subunit C